MPSSDYKSTNQCFHDALSDMRNIAKWASRDEKICRLRLCERRAKRRKPYPGAPNGVVPIIDDTVRGVVDQELTMLANARYYAHFIPLVEIATSDLAQAQMGFDTYLRFILNALPKIEEGLDNKASRGFAVIKMIRTNHPRYGEIPDFETRDIRRVIVPSGTKDIRTAERVTDLLDPIHVRDFKAMAKEHEEWDKEVVRKIEATASATEELETDSHIKSTLGTTADLLGIQTGGDGNEMIQLWEQYLYATEWIAMQDGSGSIKPGDKCKVLYCPKLPNDLLSVAPWREKDEFVQYEPEKFLKELEAAMLEEREPEQGEFVQGKDRVWPYIQCRNENRTTLYYDARGIGHTCRDDQLFATAELNAKMVMMDYYQLPLFTGAGSRTSTNVSFLPGSFLPENVTPVQMPQIPQQFDFDIEKHKRDAARRAGAVGQYEFSGDLSNKKRVQKTAREVQEESSRGSMISSASVDRFNNPWSEVFMQLWEDLARLEKQLPLISQRNFKGMMSVDVYEWPVMIVPGSSAKTLNPDLQFNRDMTAWEFARTSLASMGVVLDAEAAASDILAHWDPFKAQRWVIGKDDKAAQPVYAQLQQLTQAVQGLVESSKGMEQAVRSVGALAEENAQRLDKIAGGAHVAA